MYNYPYYWQNMQQCNLITSQFYSLQSQNVNCMQRVNDACEQVTCDAQQMILEDLRKVSVGPPKSCFNCKHKRYGFYNLSEGSCEMFSDPYYCIRMCIYSNRMYWEPDNRAADLIGLKVKAQEADDEISGLKNRLELLRIQQLQTNVFKPFESKENTASYDKPTTFIDLGAGLDNVPLRDLGIRKVYETERERTVIIEDKPEKKYTVYDLYELVFPDDPIKAHFDAERKRIIEKYKKQEEIAEKLEAPEVRRTHPEPIPTVTYDDHPILVDIACALAAVIILSMVVLALCEIFFIIL